MSDTPAQAAARAWLHQYGINTSNYTDGGGDHPAMHSLPQAFEEFAGRDHCAITVYYDTEADAAHIALRGGIGPGETARTVQACDGRINLDFNSAGQLIGVELLDMDLLHPDLAKYAIQMRPIREGDLS
jgi:uncharacterized protein YuzE